MCRIVVAVNSSGIDRQVILDLFEHFIAMSTDQTSTHELNKGKEGSFTHGHGWGMVFEEGGQLVTYKSGTRIWDDNIEPLIDRIIGSNVIVLHSRQASPGIPLGDEYVHPFTIELGGEKIAMVHNGTILHKDQIQIAPNYTPMTESDTERVLLSYASLYDRSPNLSHSELIRSLIQNLPLQSNANLVFVFDSEVIISSDFFRYPKYMGMYSLQEGPLSIVSSEPIPGMNGWEGVPNHSLLRISYKTSNDIKVI